MVAINELSHGEIPGADSGLCKEIHCVTYGEFYYVTFDIIIVQAGEVKEFT